MLGRLTFGLWLTLTVGAAATSESRGSGESVGQALCRLVQTAAQEHPTVRLLTARQGDKRQGDKRQGDQVGHHQ
jgi:hypothetical protein